MGVIKNNRAGRAWLTTTSSRLVLVTAIGMLAAPAFAQSSETLETVVVSGVRESMQNALNIKAKSNEVVDSIVAEDMGKLPDPNLSETLTRIPGIQGYRYGGEGASPVGSGTGMTIRGLTGQTSTQINGRSVQTAGQRDFNIEEGIPGLVAGIDIYKNPTADHIEGGVGGVINLRTLKPMDFNDDTFAASVTGRYNDLAKVVSPEYYAMGVHKWKMGNLGDMGFLIAGNYQESFNRSDNNPGGAGATWYLPVSCATSGVACAGTTRSAVNYNYAGNANVTKLVPVSDPRTFNYAPYGGLTASDVVSFAGYNHNVNNEDILRTRIGVSSAFQWRFNDKLEFFVDGTYNYYLYHQRYRFLSFNDSGYVTGLTTTPYNVTGALVTNRGLSASAVPANPAADLVLSSKRFATATWLDDTLTSTGGNDDRPYRTLALGGGAIWNPTEDLEVKLDLSYTKSDQKEDNRSVTLENSTGTTYAISRSATSRPATVAIAGGADSAHGYAPNDARAWVFNQYADGTNNTYDDNAGAVALDTKYALHGLPITGIKVGFRYAYLNDTYWNRAFSGKNLTKDGTALIKTINGASIVDPAVAIAVSSLNSTVNLPYQGVTQYAPTNIMGGDLGYGGGFVVYDSEMLRKNRVQSLFPLAGIPEENSLVFNPSNWSNAHEDSFAGYVMGEFDLWDGFVTGNAGVRIVGANTKNYTYVLNDLSNTASGYHMVSATGSSLEFLPSVNAIVHWTDELVNRLGYAHSETRPALSALAPTVSLSTSDDTGSIGNPSLKPYTADSFDVSFEYYFTHSAFVGIDFWDKEISGFTSGISSCMAMPGTPTPATTPNCGNATTPMRFISQTINAADGYARGLELQGQMFFDFLPGIWSHFGAQGSWSYIETKLPIPFATGTVDSNGKAVYNWYDAPQAFLSKNSMTGQLLYDDDQLSGRLVYTYRSDFVFSGIGASPQNNRVIKGYGVLDGNLSYKMGYGMTIRAGISNITNVTPNRYIGEPGVNSSAFERQSYANGRIYNLGIAFKTGE